MSETPRSGDSVRRSASEAGATESDRTTLLKLIEAHVERTDGTDVVRRYQNRVKFETDGETVGIPPSLSRAIADANGRICGNGGNRFEARVSPQ